MGVWIFDGLASVGLFTLLLPALVPAMLAVLYRRYRYLPLVPTLWAGIVFLYASALVAYTTFPLPETTPGFCADREESAGWNLVPGHSLRAILDDLSQSGPVGTLTGADVLQVVFNVVFFVPLGFLVAYLLRAGIGVALSIGLGTSLLIELTQGTGLWFLYPCPYRLADAEDLLTNTGGAALGWAIGRLVSRHLPFREPARRTDQAPPHVRRRILAAVADLLLILVLTLAAEVALLLAADLRGVDITEARAWARAVGYAVAAFLVLGVPVLRNDRATPGQVAVLVASARQDDDRAAGRARILLRFAVRWLPILVLGTTGILVVAAVESVTVLLRRDRRSLAGLVSGTRTITRDSLDTGDRLAPTSEPAVDDADR